MIIATNMSTIPQLFGGRMPQSDSDNVVLAPPNINPRSAPSLQPDEFKLYGKVYVRCCSLAKHPKATRKRQSIIWKYGEDIQLRTNSTKVTKRYWYYYLCEKKRCQQELPIVDSGNSTCLDHLKQKHHIDPQTGEHITTEDGTQTTINGPNLSTLIFRRDFDVFKDLLIRWIVYCHIAFFQIENVYFRELLFYLSPWLSKLLPKARGAIRQWVKEAFPTRKERFKKDLNEARSHISISMDAWTFAKLHFDTWCSSAFHRQNLANDELRFWRFDIYKACIVAKTWLEFYYRYSMSMVFRIELATSWRTTKRQMIPASILSYNSFTHG